METNSRILNIMDRYISDIKDIVGIMDITDIMSRSLSKPVSHKVCSSARGSRFSPTGTPYSNLPQSFKKVQP